MSVDWSLDTSLAAWRNNNCQCVAVPLEGCFGFIPHWVGFHPQQVRFSSSGNLPTTVPVFCFHRCFV